MARSNGAAIRIVDGAELERDFPMIHAVGAAATDQRRPRLVDMAWGDPSHPKATLVGKGVCFDTGGLDIKPSSGMLLMKKDMGGAANVLGLASMIMAAGMKTRLRVLIPAVENAIAGNAFRPGDVLVRIEDGIYRAKVDQARANALTQTASLDNSAQAERSRRASELAQDAAIGNAEAQLQRAQAMLLRFGRARPKPGQWEAAWLALQEQVREALAVLATAEGKPPSA